MSRRPKIRISAKDKQELARINKNVLNKKSRVRVNLGIEIDSIQTRSIDSFETRADYNRYKRQMQQFTSRSNDQYQYVKNEHGVVATKAEIKEVQKAIDKANKARKKEWNRLKKKQFKEGGSQLTVEEQRGVMGDPRYKNFKPEKFNFNAYESRRDFERRSQKKKETYKGDFMLEKARLFKRNYIKSLEHAFSDTDMDYRKIVNKIKRMSPQDFYDMHYLGEIPKIGYYYTFEALEKKFAQVEGKF